MPPENLDPQDREVLYEMYVLGLLEPEQMAEVRARIDSGDAETIEGMRRASLLMSSMAYLAPEAKAPSKLRRRLMVASGTPERSFGWGWIAGLAAAVIVLGVVTFNMRQDLDSRDAQIAQLKTQIAGNEALLAQARDLYDFLRQPGTINVKFGDAQQNPPRGQVFIHRDRGVLLFAGNLPAMPLGKIFEMWIVPKGGGAPIPAGLFKSEGSQGVHFQRGPVDPSQIAAIAVTLEPEAGSTAPTLPILFAATVAE